MNTSGIEIRETRDEDIDSLIDMFAADGNPHGWSRAKWEYYYRQFPCDAFPIKKTISIIAVETDTQTVVGHFGAVPSQISDMPTMSTTHVMLAPAARGGTTLLKLAQAVASEAQNLGARMLCVFANARFSIVAERLLKWKLLGHLHYKNIAEIDTTAFQDSFRFQAPEAWAQWKFGNTNPAQISVYDKGGETYHQTLKVLKDGHYTAQAYDARWLNVWEPHSEPSDWSQPFVIHPLDDDLPPSVFDITNWHIEMADSDTFEPYKPWQS